MCASGLLQGCFLLPAHPWPIVTRASHMNPQGSRHAAHLTGVAGAFLYAPVHPLPNMTPQVHASPLHHPHPNMIPHLDLQLVVDARNRHAVHFNRLVGVLEARIGSRVLTPVAPAECDVGGAVQDLRHLPGKAAGERGLELIVALLKVKVLRGRGEWQRSG